MGLPPRPGERAIARVAIIGGGLAGLSAACALADAGATVTLFERRRVVGGRASSFTPPGFEAPVDNCQHIAMRCCTRLLEFCERIGTAGHWRFTPEIRFLDRRGRVSVIRRSMLPLPLHTLPSFARARFLGARDKLAVARALAAVRREGDWFRTLTGVLPLAAAREHDRPFSEWLAAHGQTPGAIEALWRPLIVSALNEEPERASTRLALFVLHQAFLHAPDAHEVGVPALPLSHLFAPAIDTLRERGAKVHLGAGVRRVRVEDDRAAGIELADGSFFPADAVICAVARQAAGPLLPEALQGTPYAGAGLASSPILGIHLCFDRPVLREEHLSLVGRRIQWVFRQDRCRGEGCCLNLVVSAAREWMAVPREQILSTALGELREALPAVAEACLLRSALAKEAHATFSPAPGSDRLRPAQRTPVPGLFLAGDWTRTHWPATMEGAVESGRLAAWAVTGSC